MEEEPRLKYSRIKQLPSTFFTRDAISACFFSETHYIFASHTGLVHVTNTELEPLKTCKVSRTSVLSVHCNETTFLASSIDGTIISGNIYDDEPLHGITFNRPVHCSLLYRKSIISGGSAGDVTMSQRNWLGQRTDTILSRATESSGPIVGLFLAGDVLIFMNNDGCTFYSLLSRAVIFNIPHSSEGHWPRVHISDRILIAWGHHVWSVKITVPVQTMMSSAAASIIGTQQTTVQVEFAFECDDLVSGISSFQDDLIMLLTYQGTKRQAMEPELCLVDHHGNAEYTDTIPMKNFATLGPNDYHLGRCGLSYYLISANDGIVAKEYSTEDKKQWYIDQKMYREAWLLSGDDSLGELYAGTLCDQNEWSRAAKTLSQLGDASWATWCDKFAEAQHFDDILTVMPDNLPASVYDLFLQHYIHTSHFPALIERWEGKFSARTFAQQLEEILEQDPGNPLRRSLITLYTQLGMPSSTVVHYLYLGDEKLFDIVGPVLASFTDKLVEIVTLPLHGGEMDRDKLARPVRLLVQNVRTIPPNKVLEIFHDYEMVQYLYLKEMPHINEDLMVKLLAKFDPGELLKFLQRYSNYDPERALEACEGKTAEKIYLLGKIGDSKRALELIIEELDDPEMAISFAKEFDLWSALMDASIHKPKFIKQLLVCDPLGVLQRIESGIEIEGLSEILNRVLLQGSLQVSVEQGVLNVVDADTMKIVDQFLRIRDRGREFV